MRTKKYLRLAAGGVLFAAITYAILALPGLLTDTAPSLPVNARIAAVHP